MRIQPLYFFVAFAVGLLAVYITTSPPQIVYKFPSPYNAGKVTYRDKEDGCYVFSAEEVSCPADKNQIKPQPISI